MLNVGSRSAATQLGLCCLPMSHKKDDRHRPYKDYENNIASLGLSDKRVSVARICIEQTEKVVSVICCTKVFKQFQNRLNEMHQDLFPIQDLRKDKNFLVLHIRNCTTR